MTSIRRFLNSGAWGMCPLLYPPPVTPLFGSEYPTDSSISQSTFIKLGRGYKYPGINSTHIILLQIGSKLCASITFSDFKIILSARGIMKVL